MLGIDELLNGEETISARGNRPTETSAQKSVHGDQHKATNSQWPTDTATGSQLEVSAFLRSVFPNLDTVYMLDKDGAFFHSGSR